MSNSLPLPAGAEALKASGNDAFRQQKYKLATEKYQAAINIAPDNAVLYSNLAASLSADGALEEAISASQKAIQLDPTWFKPHTQVNAIDLVSDPSIKASNRKALDGLGRRHLTLSEPNIASASSAVADAAQLLPHPGIRAHQLVKQGKATFHPFSEGARV
ncbi:Hsp90 cochaperone [Tulasnella sp. JGI-2019a]|nr:Hsp90 cochaperone [Tulasnella sp. JGI-2019a]KAG9003689.1 Hsp90 cochaperone [Tulasnella sp. JGI-2019a]